MGLDTASNATQLTGATNGCYIAGALIGALLSSQGSDVLGRKRSIVVASSLAVLGGALQAGSVHIAMFIVARLVTGLGIGTSCAIVFHELGVKTKASQDSCFPQSHYTRARSHLPNPVA